MDIEKHIQLLRMFHYATGIPIALLQSGEAVYRLPRSIRSASSISGDKALLPVPYPSDDSVQFLSNAAMETFLLHSIGDGLLLRAGPVLQIHIGQNQLAPLIRSGILPFRCKTELLSHYAACPVLDDRHLFYSGKLLETLFANDSPVSDLTEVEPHTGTPVDKSYYSQAHDYRTRQFQHAPYAIEQEVCSMIANGDSANSKHILHEINRMPRAKLAGTPIRSLKNSMICSCTFMARAAISGGVKPEEAFTLSDAYIQRIEAGTTTNDLRGFEAEMIEGFTERVKTSRSNRFSATVNQTMQYIDVHLSEPLSNKDIAAAVFHNPTYLAGLFKRETGETIHGYILRKRIEEAEFFIRHSSDPIADIAAFYQFCSQSHFVQCFRKAKGITPGEYRRKAGSISLSSNS
jgi:AraC-like DNA-binding protein